VHVHRDSVGVDDGTVGEDSREEHGMISFDRVHSGMKGKSSLLQSSHHESTDIIEMPSIGLGDDG